MSESAATQILSDEPSQTDLLGFSRYSQALSDIVASPNTRTPFIIGVFGRWGTGKSTLMRMIEKTLDQRGATTIWFNAWRYSQESELWAAFLQTLTSRLAQRLNLYDKLRFSAGVYRRGFNWSRLLYEAPRVLGTIVLIAVPVVLAQWLSSVSGSKLISQWLTATGALGSVAVSFACVIRPIVAAVRRKSRMDFSLYRSVDFEQHVGFLDRFRDQFARIVESLPGSLRRVVIFIDDLDRCAVDKVLPVLDAIKVFLDVPQCVFVIGADVGVLHKALAQKYANDTDAQREYLSKIIQLPFYIPALRVDDVAQYLRQLDVQFPDDRCRDVFLGCLAKNPREIKRVINTYGLYLLLSAASSTRAALLPVRLAKVIVIQLSFPTLFAVIREQPAFLASFEAALRGIHIQEARADQTIVGEQQGISVPPALSPFVNDPSLRQMLTMHPLQRIHDDANFAYLSEEDISAYFTLTVRISAEFADRTQLSASSAEGSDSGQLPDCGPRYQLQRRIGLGGTSAVYLAEDRDTGQLVAIKRLLPTLEGDRAWMRRFRNEGLLALSIGRHPNIVQMLQANATAGSDGRGPIFHVSEYAAGDTLAVLLEQKTRLSLSEARSIFGGILEALVHLQQHGIVHRDIKPSSIVVGHDGIARIVDLGIAVSVIATHEPEPRIGTLAYMSAEQDAGTFIDGRSDLYSLGLVMFQALTGLGPLSPDWPKNRHAPEVGLIQLAEPMRAFVSQMIADDRNQRFADAKQAASAFAYAFADRATMIAKEPP